MPAVLPGRGRTAAWGFSPEQFTTGAETPETENVAIEIKKVAIGSEKVAIGSEKVAIGSEKVAIGSEKVAIELGNVAIELGNVAIESDYAATAGLTASSNTIRKTQAVLQKQSKRRQRWKTA